jgi:O-antigen ligase
MKDIFIGLRPFQKAEFLIMLLLAFAIPFSWLAAQYCEVALLVCAILKVVFDQKFKFNEQQMKFKWAYIIFAMTWLIYLIGMIYTENQSVGWAQVSKKLGFLIFPMIFLFSDMSYLTRQRLKAIGNALILGCILFFMMNLVYAAYDVLFNGYTVDRFFDQELMKWYYVHHSYLSMYASLGLMFCFMEIFGDGNRKTKIINIIAYIILVIFIILVRSRAGLIWMVLTFVLQWIWLTFLMKKKKAGLIMGGVFALAVAGACVAFPQSVARITTTIKDIMSEHSSDHRLVQFKGYRSVLEENWLFGVGTGDRTDETQASYHRYKAKLDAILGPEMVAAIDLVIDDYWYEPDESMRQDMMAEAVKYGVNPEIVSTYLVEYQFIRYAIDNEINAHNMFFETVISVGIIGLLLLLAYFVIPLVLWIKTKSFDMLYCSFLLMIGFNALFESIFEVQLGIIFFCFFNSLLFNMSFVQNEISHCVRNDK